MKVMELWQGTIYELIELTFFDLKNTQIGDASNFWETLRHLNEDSFQLFTAKFPCGLNVVYEELMKD